MLIHSVSTGTTIIFYFGEHASECGHYVAWNQVSKRGKPRTLKYDKAPRFRLCAECAARESERIARAG